jgi:hypothetical protein
MKGLRGHIITEFRRRFLWWGYSSVHLGKAGLFEDTCRRLQD